VAFTPTSETDWWEARGKGSFVQLFYAGLSKRYGVPNGIRYLLERRLVAPIQGGIKTPHPYNHPNIGG